MIEGNLEELLKIVKISPEEAERAEGLDSTVVEGFGDIYGPNVDVESYGSSNRGTFIPSEKYRLPRDVDVTVSGPGIGEGEKDLGTLVALFEDRKGKLEASLSGFYGRKPEDVELRLYKAEDTNGRAAVNGDEFTQTRYEAVDKRTGEVLLEIDVSYGDAQKYPQAFEEQMNYSTANLSPEDRLEGKRHITYTIVGVKSALDAKEAYGSKNGVPGVLVEQLVMQQNGDVQFNNLEALKANYTVSGVFEKIAREGRNLKIRHPITGKDLTENLSKNNGAGREKLLAVAESYQNSFMDKGSGLDGRIDGIYLPGIISDRAQSSVSSPAKYARRGLASGRAAPAYV